MTPVLKLAPTQRDDFEALCNLTKVSIAVI